MELNMSIVSFHCPLTAIWIVSNFYFFHQMTMQLQWNSLLWQSWSWATLEGHSGFYSPIDEDLTPNVACHTLLMTVVSCFFMNVMHTKYHDHMNHAKPLWQYDKVMLYTLLTYEARNPLLNGWPTSNGQWSDIVVYSFVNCYICFFMYAMCF